MTTPSALAVIATELSHLRRSHTSLDAKIGKVDEKLDLEVKGLEASETQETSFRSEIKGALSAMNAFGRIATVGFAVLQTIIFIWVGSINASMASQSDRLTRAEDRAADLKDVKSDIAAETKEAAKVLAVIDQMETHATIDEGQITKMDASLQALEKTVTVLSEGISAFGRSLDTMRPVVQQLQIDDDARQTKVNHR